MLGNLHSSVQQYWMCTQGFPGLIIMKMLGVGPPKLNIIPTISLPKVNYTYLKNTFTDNLFSFFTQKCRL